MSGALLRLLLVLVAAVTVLSGLVQMLAPGAVLGVIAPEATPMAAHFFRTVGMFMLVTGAMFLQSLLSRSEEPAIPLWIGAQKLLAAILVAWGWAAGHFLWLALGVALFDAASGVLALMLWRRLPR